MTSPMLETLPTEYQRLCPWFNRSSVEKMAHWVKDPTLILDGSSAFKMLYISEFTGKTPWLTSRDNYRWMELEAWLDAHRISLLQRLEAEAPIPAVENTPSPPQREHPSSGRKVVRVPWMEELRRDTLTGSEKMSMHTLVVLSLLLRIIIII